MSASSDQHREDILRAAIVEFGRMGYAAASTNTIIKQAQVSKGLLFHYFTNKEKLYKAAQLYVMEQYGYYMAQRMDTSTPDFFERILTNLRIKMEYGCENADFLALINQVLQLESDENTLTKPEAEAYVMEQWESKAKRPDFFGGLDLSLFREGIEVMKVMDITRLALEACWLRFSQRYDNDMHQIVKEMDSYFAECEDIIMLLKKGAYR